jgi:hypothetical protein
MRGISWLAEKLLASQEELCSMERACKQASQPASTKFAYATPILTIRNNTYYYYLHVINYKTWHFYEIHQLLFQKLRVLRVMLITIGKTGGCKGGICPSNIFLRLRRFFGHRVKEGQIRNINISKWLSGWCKDREGLKNIRFTGRRIKASESPIYKGRVALYIWLPPPILLSKLRLCVIHRVTFVRFEISKHQRATWWLSLDETCSWFYL